MPDEHSTLLWKGMLKIQLELAYSSNLNQRELFLAKLHMAGLTHGGCGKEIHSGGAAECCKF